MYILGIDLEGAHKNLVEEGIDHATDRVIEVGAVLWDTEESGPVKVCSELIDEEDRLPLDQEVSELTGINEKILAKWGLRAGQIEGLLDSLVELMGPAQAIMAHNGGQYDQPMLEALFKRQKKALPKKIWIDSRKHIEFPKKIHGLSMAVLEHSHGFINPFPHRALTDVLAMFKVASHYSFERMLALAQSPVVTLVASFAAPNWNDPEEMKKFNRLKSKVSRAQFRWQANEKKWTKQVPRLLLDEGKVVHDFDYYVREN